MRRIRTCALKRSSEVLPRKLPISLCAGHLAGASRSIRRTFVVALRSKEHVYDCAFRPVKLRTPGASSPEALGSVLDSPRAWHLPGHAVLQSTQDSREIAERLAAPDALVGRGYYFGLQGVRESGFDTRRLPRRRFRRQAQR